MGDAATREEQEAAEKLRSLCDADGRELDPRACAEPLYRLGVIYAARERDKTCLVQGCGLLMAAEVRGGIHAADAKRARTRLHRRVLELAAAQRRDADIDAIAANIYRRKIVRMRAETAHALASASPSSVNSISERDYEEQKVAFVARLQTDISAKYCDVMREISDECVAVLGPAPCRFAHVGLGSLARDEVTPFSDFESALVLDDAVAARRDYDDALEYFRWFAVLFQFVLVAFGETIVPTLAVPCLNDVAAADGGDWFYDVSTPRGICFDGLMPHACKSPLGRQRKTARKPWITELIKPVADMIGYLDHDEDAKNGYRLAEILSAFVYVAGDRALYREYEREVYIRLNTCDACAQRDRLLQRIRDDLDSFAVFSSLSTAHASRSINTKHVIYRSTTVFISTLARLHRIKGGSCFRIIDELRMRDVISPDAAHNLKFAVAVACDVRLKVYMRKNAQRDSVSLHRESAFDDSEFHNTADVQDVIKYFTIAFCLQRNMRRGFAARWKENMRAVDSDVEVGIAFYFQQYQTVIDKCLDLRRGYLSPEAVHDKVIACTSIIAKCFYKLEKFEAALEECKREIAYIERNRDHLHDSQEGELADCRRSVGRCLYKLKRFPEALTHLQQERALRSKLVADDDADGYADCVDNIGNCHFAMGEFARAVQCFDEVLRVARDRRPNDAREQAKCLTNSAGCFFKLGKFGNALHRYRKARDLRASVSHDVQKDCDVAECVNMIAHCLFKIGKIDKARAHYEDALAAWQRCAYASDSQIATSIGDCEANIASCHVKSKRFDRAIQHYERLLAAQKPRVDLGHLNSLANCYFQLGRYDDALSRHEQELDLRTTGDACTCQALAKCLNHVGCDLYCLRRYDEALAAHERELKLRQRLSESGVPSQMSVAKCHNNVASCLVQLKSFQLALEHYDEEVGCYDRAADRDKVVSCLMNKANCLFRLGRVDEASSLLKEAELLKRENV